MWSDASENLISKVEIVETADNRQNISREYANSNDKTAEFVELVDRKDSTESFSNTG